MWFSRLREAKLDNNSTSGAKPSCFTFQANRGRSTNAFTTGRSRSGPVLPPLQPPPRRLIFRSLVLGEKRWRRQGRGDGVFLNALISVTVWAASSLMWNRHFGSVAHAVKKGCDVLMEKQHPPVPGTCKLRGYICLCAPLSCQEASPTSPTGLLLPSNSPTAAWTLPSTAWCWWWSSSELYWV